LTLTDDKQSLNPETEATNPKGNSFFPGFIIFIGVLNIPFRRMLSFPRQWDVVVSERRFPQGYHAYFDVIIGQGWPEMAGATLW